jgi:hypothetical protein
VRFPALECFDFEWHFEGVKAVLIFDWLYQLSASGIWNVYGACPETVHYLLKTKVVQQKKNSAIPTLDAWVS